MNSSDTDAISLQFSCSAVTGMDDAISDVTDADGLNTWFVFLYAKCLILSCYFVINSFLFPMTSSEISQKFTSYISKSIISICSYLPISSTCEHSIVENGEYSFI